MFCSKLKAMKALHLKALDVHASQYSYYKSYKQMNIKYSENLEDKKQTYVLFAQGTITESVCWLSWCIFFFFPQKTIRQNRIGLKAIQLQLCQQQSCRAEFIHKFNNDKIP